MEIDYTKELEFYNDIMSHDINNINQGIIGYLELLLQDKKIDEATKKYLELIYNQVLRSSRLISDVKKLKQIKDKKFEPENRDLISIIKEAEENIINKFSERIIEIGFSSEYKKCMVKADSYLEDIFLNILSNAIIYNDNDIVEISINITKDEENPNYWKVSITDSAKGIPDELKTAIFNQYQRNRIKDKNAGLGLDIVNAIIDRYSGKIWVQNKVEDDYTKGSVFNFVLPGGEGL